MRNDKLWKMNCSGVLLLRSRLGRRRRLQVALISAIFIRTAARGALPGSLLEQEGSATLRALLDNGLVPKHALTLRILRAAIEGFAALGSLDDQLALTTRTRTGDSGGLAFDVLALRIIRAGNELAKSSLAFHQLRAIDGAFLFEQHGRRAHLAALGNLPDVATLGIP